jgi:hypothetical protein
MLEIAIRRVFGQVLNQLLSMSVCTPPYIRNDSHANAIKPGTRRGAPFEFVKTTVRDEKDLLNHILHFPRRSSKMPSHSMHVWAMRAKESLQSRR